MEGVGHIQVRHAIAIHGVAAKPRVQEAKSEAGKYESAFEQGLGGNAG
jgi:hypothetical protein